MTKREEPGGGLCRRKSLLFPSGFTCCCFYGKIKKIKTICWGAYHDADVGCDETMETSNGKRK